MSRRPRRNHTPAFKAKAALAGIKGDRTLAQLAGQFDVHPNQVTTWKAQREGGAADVFGLGGGSASMEPAVDVKSLHAKIGELTPGVETPPADVSVVTLETPVRMATAGACAAAVRVSAGRDRTSRRIVPSGASSMIEMRGAFGAAKKRVL